MKARGDFLDQDNILVMKSITKSFPGVLALDSVDIYVEKGEIHFIVGENGAGKSTLMKVLSGIYPYGDYSGDILFQDQIKHFHGIKDSVSCGIVIINQELALFPDLSVYENIFVGHEKLSRGFLMDWDETKKLAKKFLDIVKLDIDIYELVGPLGVGKQQLIEIAKALSHNVKLLILDEPFTGLDPINQLLLKEIIQEKAQAGKTIIFSTHQMEQVERLCSNISLINKGKIILEGELRAVKDSKKTKAIEVVFDGKVDIEKVENYLENVIVKENFVSGIVKKDHRSFLNWINKIVDVESFQVKIPTLEQIFIDEVRESR